MKTRKSRKGREEQEVIHIKTIVNVPPQRKRVYVHVPGKCEEVVVTAFRESFEDVTFIVPTIYDKIKKYKGKVYKYRTAVFYVDKEYVVYTVYCVTH